MCCDQDRFLEKVTLRYLKHSTIGIRWFEIERVSGIAFLDLVMGRTLGGFIVKKKTVDRVVKYSSELCLCLVEAE